MCEAVKVNVDKIGGRKPLPVPLDENDEKLLREVVACTYWSPSQIRRAEAVLGVAQGGRLCQLAGQIGYSPASIRRACRSFQREGVMGLITEKMRPGRPRTKIRQANLLN